MSRQMFLVFFLFLFVCCQLCRQGHTVNSAQAPGKATENKFFEFLKQNEKIKVDPTPQGVEGQVTDFTVKNIESVRFVTTESVMVAFAAVNYTKTNPDENEYTGILENCIKTDEESLKKETIKSDKWKNLATKKFQKSKRDTSIKSFAVVVKGKTIYYITVSNEILKDGDSPGSFPEWHARLVKGTVPDSSGGAAETINWQSAIFSTTYVDNGVPKKPNNKPAKIPPSDGFAFVTEEEKIYFFMKGEKATRTSVVEDKNIVSVFLLDKNGKELKLLPVENIENCYPYFFQWKGEIIMMPTKDQTCNDKTLMVFDASQNKFTERKSPIARLSNFFKDKSGFSPAVIEEKEVLFFTEQKNTKDDKNVYLWMSDGTRVGYVGIIDSNGEHMFYKLVLYSKEKLFALRQKYKLEDNDKQEVEEVFVTHLKEQFENVTKIFKAWKEGNETVLALCEKSKNLDALCTTPPSTDGLVGFLRNTIKESEKTIWKDELVYSNATVEKGNPVINGITFNGVGAGATWPVNGQNQKYYFSNYGFTLVATVKIDSDANKNSILGIGLGGNKNSIGVWCSEGKWSVTDGSTAKPTLTEKACVKASTYEVALILKENNNFLLYIGEKKDRQNPDSTITLPESLSITHFYFGAEKEKTTVESYVTVTNVLLYNRPFEESEIKNLKENIKTPKKDIKAEQVEDNTGSGSDEQTSKPLPSNTTGEEKKDGKTPSPSRTEDGGLYGGVRVFSLLLAVLCVSAPLLHL